MPPENEVIQAAQAEAYFNAVADSRVSPPIPPRTEVPIVMDRDLDMDGHTILHAVGVVGEQGPAGPQGEPGPAGAAGSNGTNGLNGRTILSGAGAPSSGIGSNGDFYINTSASTLYGPKTSGSWGSPTSLVGATGSTGPQGDPGPQGDQGPAGNDGTDGQTILNGSGAPTTEGVNGDFYLDTATNELYGPKTAGAWGSGISLVGPQGDPGATGPQGDPGQGVPAGGTTGQQLVKATNDDYDTEWTTPAAGSEAFPVGSVFISVVSTDPATLLGYGTWAAFGAGRVLVGRDSGDTDFDTAEETGGAKTHTLTEAEMPAHTHIPRAANEGANNVTPVARVHAVVGTAADGFRAPGSSTFGNMGASTTSTGGDGAHNNLQPYIVVYMWKRTA